MPLAPGKETGIPFNRAERRARRLIHDFRNDLGAIDLQAAFIGEIAAEPQVRAELARLRAIIAETAGRLRDVSKHVRPPAVNGSESEK